MYACTAIFWLLEAVCSYSCLLMCIHVYLASSIQILFCLDPCVWRESQMGRIYPLCLMPGPSFSFLPGLCIFSFYLVVTTIALPFPVLPQEPEFRERSDQCNHQPRSPLIMLRVGGTGMHSVPNREDRAKVASERGFHFSGNEKSGNSQ